jgi:carboxymethylenebutenolidase
MTQRVSPFSIEQIGTTAVRFPSGAPIPSISDASVDPYWKTRISKAVHVEGVLVWPQEKGLFPGLVILHERWGLTTPIKDIALRFACEGYMVLVPNLYGRQGGMVTASADVADALASRIKEPEAMQDINSCCEFLNTRDQQKKNVHGVVGIGLGGTLALGFARHRKRLRAAVSFYGAIAIPPASLKDLVCPLLYHRAGTDATVTDEQLELLREAEKASGKPVTINTYADAPPAFLDPTRKDTYRKDASEAAWESTISFLSDRLQGDR